jgi:hypothetical protein
MKNHDATTPSEWWISIDIPVNSIVELGFHPYAAKYEAEVLQYFSLTDRVRWFGSGRTVRPSHGGDIVEKITWDFGVGDLEVAIEGFKTMFRERSFPDGTEITKVTRHPDYSFSFECLLIWPVDCT